MAQINTMSKYLELNLNLNLGGYCVYNNIIKPASVKPTIDNYRFKLFCFPRIVVNCKS